MKAPAALRAEAQAKRSQAQELARLAFTISPHVGLSSRTEAIGRLLVEAAELEARADALDGLKPR
jgi:hypothetical protein